MNHVAKLIEKRLSKKHIKASMDAHHESILLNEVHAFETFEFIKQDPDISFDMLLDLTALAHEKLGDTCLFNLPDEELQNPAIEVFYLLRSTRLNIRLSASIICSSQHPFIMSIAPIYDNASFLERELFDMFGIRAEGSPQHRRLLTYPGFRGYPLLKSFNAHHPPIMYRE